MMFPSPGRGDLYSWVRVWHCTVCHCLRLSLSGWQDSGSVISPPILALGALRQTRRDHFCRGPEQESPRTWSLAPPAALQLHAARQWHNASSPPVFSISLTCLCLWFCQSRLQVMEHQFNHYLQFIVTVSAQNVLENELELVFCL